MDSVNMQNSDDWFKPPLSPSYRNYIDHGKDFVFSDVKHDQLFNYPEQLIGFESNPMFDEMCMEYIRTGEWSSMLDGSLHEADCQKQFISQAASLSPSSHIDQGNGVVPHSFKLDQQQLQPMLNVIPTIIVSDYNCDFEWSSLNEDDMSCFKLDEVSQKKGDAPTPKPEEEDGSQTLEDLVDICNLHPANEMNDSSMQIEPQNEEMVNNHLSASYCGTTTTNTTACQIKQSGPPGQTVTDDFQVVNPSNNLSTPSESTLNDDDAAQNQVSTNASFAGSAIDSGPLGEAFNKHSIATYTEEGKKSNKKIQRNSHKAAQNCNKILPTAQLEKDDNTTKKRRRGREPIGNEPKKSSRIVASYRSTTKATSESADLFIKKCFDCSLGFKEQQLMLLCETYEVAVTKLSKKYGWDKEVLLKKVEFHKPTLETLHPRYGPGREAADPDDAQMRTIRSGPRVPLLLLYDQLLQLQKKQVPDYNIVMEDLKTNRPKLYHDLTTTRRRLISRELSNPPHQGPLIPTAEPNQAATKSRKRSGDHSVGPTSRAKKRKFV